MCQKVSHIKAYTLVKDVYTPYLEDYIRDSQRKLFLLNKHYRAFNMAMYCRTESMGRVVFGCSTCGQRHEMYKSCKHRFCAQCGVVETYRWGDSLGNRLLNIPHSHITFTLPSGLRVLGKGCESGVYDCMFKAVNEVMQSWFLAKYGIKCGVVMVLHTAGSDLKYHPHIHCIVSCGGVLLESESGHPELKNLGTNYLCSHKHLGNQFRIRLSNLLRERCVAGRLSNADGEVMSLGDLNWQLQLISRKNWIVGVEKGLWEVAQIVGYVGRYTKRACMSEYKISDISEGEIAFTYNDYANTPKGERPVVSTKRQSMTSFLDSLLQHVPDKGFHCVRYCGVYANAAHKGLPSSFLAAQKEEEAHGETEDRVPTSEVEQYKRYRKTQEKLYQKDPLRCQCGKDMEFRYLYIGNKRILGKIQADTS
jgi:hypothetical protein